MFNLNVPFVVKFGTIFGIVEVGYAPSHVWVLSYNFLNDFVLSVVVVTVSLFHVVRAGVPGEGWQVWVVHEVFEVVEFVFELLFSAGQTLV